MIRIAAIGTGRITRCFLEAAVACGVYDVVGVYSREVSRAAAWGLRKTWPSLDALAADSEVDAVYIASPNACHFAQAKQMLLAKKHVLCEKPAVPNAAQWDRLTALAQQQGVCLLEGLRTVFAPGFAALTRLLPLCGAVRQVMFHYGQYSSRYDNFKQGLVENAFRPELANGALMDLGVYPASVLTALFGAPADVTADAVMLPGSIDGAGTVIARYPTMQAVLTYSKISETPAPSLIVGEDGTLEIDHIVHPRRITVRPRGGEPTVYEVDPVTAPTPSGGNQLFDAADNPLLYEAQAFAQYVADGWVPPHHAARTHDTLSLMDAVRRACAIRFPADEEE